MPDRVNADVRPCVRPKCETHETPRIASGPHLQAEMLEVATPDGPAWTPILASAGVWHVTARINGLSGYTVTHGPTGMRCPVAPTIERAESLMRAMHAAAPRWLETAALVPPDGGNRARAVYQATPEWPALQAAARAWHREAQR